MKQTFWNKKIPTLLGIGFIAIGAILTTYLVQTGVIVIGRATPSYTPENIRITNISDTSFTVSYTTKEKAVGSISYGTDKETQSTILDDRDSQAGSVTPYNVHYFSIHRLQPETKYFFTIASNETVFLNNEEPFTVTTGPPITNSPTEQNPLSGKIVFPNNQEKEAIVYLTSDNSQAISALVKTDGSYILPLNSIRNQNLSSYASFDEDQIINMLVIGNGITSNIKLSAKQISPVPQLTLSNNYDFTIKKTPVSSESAVPVGFPSFSSVPKTDSEPEITIPQEDEEFVDDQPLFRGTASPSATVKITINSEHGIEVKVTADRNGVWTYRPEAPLAPGEHTISITTRDNFGIIKTIAKPFTVYASGTQIENTTPSVSPIPTVETTPQPEQISPTLQVSPSQLPSPTPSELPSPTPTIVIAPTIAPPGNSTTTFWLASFVSIIIGGMLFLLARKQTV